MSKYWDIWIYFYANANGRVVKVFTKCPIKTSEKYKLESILFKMRPFTWEMHNRLNKTCARNGNHNDIDYLMLKELKIIDGIYDWNIKNKNGKKIKVSKENIFNLHPTIVETLSDEYDKLSYVSAKEKKSLVLSINKYYMSTVAGTGNVSSPPEVVELSMMEKFGWTPHQIDEIPYKKIQEMFLVLNQREISSESAMKFKMGGK